MKMKVKVKAITLVFIFFKSNIIFAEGINNPTIKPDSTSLFPALFQLIFTLGFILGLLYFVFRFLSKKTGSYRNPIYKHLGGLPLGQNKSVQLVEINNKVYILGVGENIQLIQMVDDPEEVIAMKASNSSNMNENNYLKDWMKQIKESPLYRTWMSKWAQKKVSGLQPQNFEQILSGKMEELKERRNEKMEQLFEDDYMKKERDNHE